MKTTDQIVDLLYEALKHEYVVYVDDVLKTVGFLLVALGWLMTSETARKALRAPYASAVALGCTFAIAANVAVVLVGHYVRSLRIEENLSRMAPEMGDLIANYAITKEHVLLNAVVLIALVVFLFTIIWRLRTNREE